MDETARMIILFSSCARAFLTVWILLRCTRSMLREKYEPEVWAYLELPGGESRALNHWECILGRARSSDVVFPDRGVSRNHAALQRSAGGRWTIYDLQSETGTTVNGKRIPVHARLRSGDKIGLGGLELTFVDLSGPQRRTLQRKRRTPGRKIRPAPTLLLLTAFEFLLALELLLNVEERYMQPVAAAYTVLIAVEWLCFVLVRALHFRGFEVETLAFFLSAVGLAVRASADPGEMMKASILFAAGVVVFALLGWWLRDLRRVKLLRTPMAVAAVLFLCLNLLLSEEIFGAKNWLMIGGYSLQPSELVKVAYVYAGASTLDRLFLKQNLISYTFFSALIVGALALMGDFGTALVFFVCFLVVSFMRSGSFGTVLLAVTGAVLAGVLVLTVKPYVAQRFASWRHVWEDPLGAGYQQVRAMSATASGGLFGQGAGNGWLRNIAAADTDLVFGMVAEELGLIVAFGCLTAVILLALFVVRNAATGRSAYYVIAACAAVTIMMTQVALNVFGSLDILPFTGVTFPLVSRGGSSEISCWALLAYIKAADTRQKASFALHAMLDEEKDADRTRKKDRSARDEDGEEYDGYEEPDDEFDDDEDEFDDGDEEYDEEDEADGEDGE